MRCFHADLLGTHCTIELDLPRLNNVGVASNVRVRVAAAEKPESTFADAADANATETITYDDVNAYQDEIDSMTESVLDGAPPVITLTDSRENAQTLNALCRSAREGHPVTL